jgi:hypothetical protein
MYRATTTANTESNSIQPRMESLPHRMVDHLAWPGGGVFADVRALVRLCGGVLVADMDRIQGLFLNRTYVLQWPEETGYQ